MVPVALGRDGFEMAASLRIKHSVPRDVDPQSQLPHAVLTLCQSLPRRLSQKPTLLYLHRCFRPDEPPDSSLYCAEIEGCRISAPHSPRTFRLRLYRHAICQGEP